ncbi:MAG: iron-sulfur cluster assembly scaffold protein [Anaerolineae bacterium]|jgi:nitrogen fixation NifU-like protein|nr:iron-sulfur cluster assembly scaffold protein [Anaerolineae bacterium]
MDAMYRENILDHGMNPRNKGVINPATLDFEMRNPLCGDRLRLTLRVNDEHVITALGWDGEGCAVSQAAASMLGERILGMTIEEVKHLTKEDVFEMLGIPLTANRVKCALLGLKVLHVGLYGLEFWQSEDEE